MKRFLTIIVMATAVIAMHAKPLVDGRMFKDISNLPGVESVYIGPAMMRFAGTASMLSSENDKIFSEGIKELKSVEIINCSNADSNKKIDAAVQKIIEKHGLELLLEISQQDETMNIYGIVPDDGSSVISNAVIVSLGKKESSVIYIEGVIDIAKLNQGG